MTKVLRILMLAILLVCSNQMHAYHNISPYAWCAGNPVAYVDPDGKRYMVNDIVAQKAILNTLSEEEARYVRFNEDGSLNRGVLLSHQSTSCNYNAICEIEKAPEIVSIEMNDHYQYMDNDNALHTSEVMHYDVDDDFKEAGVTHAYSNTTGETGRLGITLLPGKGTSNINSIDGDIHVILNKNLSQEGAAANISHEVNGHVLMYLRTHDRQLSGHDFKGSLDTNRQLTKLIYNSLMETISHMRQ